MSTNIPTSVIDEGASPTEVARILHATGVAVVQADISGTASNEIEVKVFDLSLDDPSVAIYTATFDKANLIFDTLQTDGYWDVDSAGYNFRHTLDGDQLTKGSHSYLVEYTFTLTSSRGKVWVRRYIKMESVKGS